MRSLSYGFLHYYLGIAQQRKGCSVGNDKKLAFIANAYLSSALSYSGLAAPEESFHPIQLQQTTTIHHEL
jgi:hypothetical protein